MSERARVIVVGSGIAGLVAAMELSRTHAVTLVTKAKLADSNTRWAQGGVAAVMFADDSVAEHVADTLKAGAGLCDREAVEILCAEGPRRIRALMELGVAFDREGAELARGLEAAHSHARVLHAGGDATGFNLEMTLVRVVRELEAAGKLTVMEDTFACDLELEDGAVCGLVVLRSGTRRVLAAEVVVLASGGAGQMFLHTTNPAVATGDGVAMALRAGAAPQDVEFYQFHPTALALPGSFLVSEAVRGEGAVLLDRTGQRFMVGVDPAAELAPRDVVARGIARQMAAQGGVPVRLDATRLGGAAFLKERFPSIDAACRERGLDWAREPIPVTPAAHYWMGGVRTDVWGRTSVAGLYAVGECACTGVHGANRLASNSLLESLVFAWRCAEFVAGQAAGLSAASSQKREDFGRDGKVEVTKAKSRSFAALRMTISGEGKVAVEREALRRLMWEAAGIERSGDGLRAALATLDSWRVEGEDVAALETANLLALSRVLVAAALAREESRGAHFRSDFPEAHEVWRHSQVVAATVLEAAPC